MHKRKRRTDAQLRVPFIKATADQPIQGLQLEPLCDILLLDGFVPVHEEADQVVLQCIHNAVCLYIAHKNNIITQIECFGKFKKNYIPLGVACLQKFIVEARTNRQFDFLNN